MAMLDLGIAKYLAIMAGYQLFLWERLNLFCNDLPDKKKLVAKVPQTEALWLSEQQINIHLIRSCFHYFEKTCLAVIYYVVIRGRRWKISFLKDVHYYQEKMKKL